MASYEMTGTVKLMLDLQTFSSGFSKREFVLSTQDGRFPQDIKFECVKEKTALLDNLKPGQTVKVTFDIRGNEYKERYYVNLTAWRIEPAGEGAASGDDEHPPIEDPDDLPDSDGTPPF